MLPTVPTVTSMLLTRQDPWLCYIKSPNKILKNFTEEHSRHDRDWTISRKNYQSNRTRQKNERWDRKGDSDDSLEIPEKGRESDCTWTGLLVSVMGLIALTNIDTGDDGWFCLHWHFFVWNIGHTVRSLKICMMITPTQVSVCCTDFGHHDLFSRSYVSVEK